MDDLRINPGNPDAEYDEAEFQKALAEVEKEIAVTKDRRQVQGLNLARVSDLVRLVADVIETLEQKTRGGREARFVANFVRAAIEHWQPPAGK